MGHSAKGRFFSLVTDSVNNAPHIVTPKTLVLFVCSNIVSKNYTQTSKAVVLSPNFAEIKTAVVD